MNSDALLTDLNEFEIIDQHLDDKTLFLKNKIGKISIYLADLQIEELTLSSKLLESTSQVKKIEAFVLSAIIQQLDDKGKALYSNEVLRQNAFQSWIEGTLDIPGVTKAKLDNYLEHHSIEKTYEKALRANKIEQDFYSKLYNIGIALLRKSE